MTTPVNLLIRSAGRWVWWLPPLLLWGGDALAWGLCTHVHFAQALLWMSPLADPRFRRAARRLPRLVLAGACLPDLVVVHRLARHPLADRFDATHQWDTAQRLLAAASSDAERAAALGFATHLLTDIYAHNHFVPAHELLWGNVPVLTHAACEWALDHHLVDTLPAPPAELLRRERRRLGRFVAAHFGCGDGEAQQAILRLARADATLRGSRLPALAHAAAGRADRHMTRRFGHFLAETHERLRLVDRLIAGDAPAWEAEVCPRQARAQLLSRDREELRGELRLPGDVFAPAV